VVASSLDHQEMAFEDKQLAALVRRIDDVALDTALWPEVMQEIAHCVGATGACLLQADVRTPDVPRTEGIADLFTAYFAGGWHLRDVRARAAPLLIRGERRVITDADCVTIEEMDHGEYYNDLLRPHKLRWFAAVGFASGNASWGLSIHRTAPQGLFDASEQRQLARLSGPLTAAATLSRTVSHRVLTGCLDALAFCEKAAVAIDRFGRVLRSNRAADDLFGPTLWVRKRQLFLSDKQAKADLTRVLAWLESGQPIERLPVRRFPVRHQNRTTLICRVIPVPDGAAEPFLGARALLTFTEVEPQVSPDVDLLARSFGLTPAESRLAALIGKGLTLADAALQLKVSIATVRNQLKAVFLKTETRRQSDLVLLIGPFQNER
jgi:DNA-binding CsgD family transcriptional regulator